MVLVKCVKCDKGLEKINAVSIHITQHRGKFNVVSTYHNREPQEIERPIYEYETVRMCKECFGKESISKYTDVLN